MKFFKYTFEPKELAYVYRTLGKFFLKMNCGKRLIFVTIPA